MKVGVISKLIKSSYGETMQAIDLRFCPILEQNGFKTNLLIYGKTPNLKELDAVIISGGNDLNSLIPNDINAARDEFETIVLDECLKLNLPILGICKGAQSLANILGAKFKKIDNHVGVHEILWRNGKKFEVNSYHNWAIEYNLNSEILATSSDNTVEAFINNDKKIIGAMWHFEREETLSAASKEIFKIFKELK
ncbi:gamma-glutamyl-gamma-aminobutyrate hydrolase family protein [Campylobacter fetus]|uniref:gamma-glutamyl-gamma-aminobutyrate hydrolase family protein n=1 Tax=Campylobacter fetus TaxID=196 RepID=UPI000FC9F422|nr:gamma-glutamyl-gamma-aminobutyrate hydrolase family protein [Campylobacter fetus]RUT50322.1 hypothetical protein BWK67_03820 [Campylobacter fetus]RUT50643.1 hypothetical protein BWK51_03820 [Campylobacter fetus]